MKNISIRVATKQDAEMIIELQQNDGYEHSYSLTKQRFMVLLKKGEVFYLAHLNGDPIAMIAFDNELRAKLHFFSVHKDFQRKGYGSYILEKLIKEIQENNNDIKVVYSYSEEGSPSCNFFLKNKFKKVGFYKNRFRKGRNAIIFERVLNSN